MPPVQGQRRLLPAVPASPAVRTEHAAQRRPDHGGHRLRLLLVQLLPRQPSQVPGFYLEISTISTLHISTHTSTHIYRLRNHTADRVSLPPQTELGPFMWDFSCLFRDKHSQVTVCSIYSLQYLHGVISTRCYIYSR